MAEVLCNAVASPLAGAITSGDTSLDVTSATGFPTSGDFRIRLDSELLLVTAVSGTTFTVTRGIEGTAAAAHRKGALVRGGVLTAGGLAQYVADAPETAPLVAKTGDYPVTAADEIVTVDATAGVVVVTLPTAVGKTGRRYEVWKIDAGANAVNVASTSAQTFNGAASPVALAAQWDWAVCVSDGANWLVRSGSG